jgi:hypothetical protein
MPLAPAGPQGKRCRPAGALAGPWLRARPGGLQVEQTAGNPNEERSAPDGAEGPIMNRHDIDDLREKVPCAALLEQQGWGVDIKESTARAIKYRNGAGEIVIVIHDGKGWFDPLSDAKGDVFNLARHLLGVGFHEAALAVAKLDGFVPTAARWEPPVRATPLLPIRDRWNRRPPITPRSAAWRYLLVQRGSPADMLRWAVAQNLLRAGPAGSVWAAHADHQGVVTGWEERGPDWRGFATDGLKVLFRLGEPEARRLCITEASIDAMSLAALEAMRTDTLYLSTGGGWSPATDAALRSLAERDGATIVAATDNDEQGEIYAGRLQALAMDMARDYERLRPAGQDWNDDRGSGKAI